MELFRISFRSVYIVSAIILLTVLGCGGDPFDYVQIQGKVTYTDGSVIPAEILQVRFVPQAGQLDSKTTPRPGIAEVKVTDGTFDIVTSHRFGDGVVRGPHKVTVVALDTNLNPTSAVPSEYATASTTPLEIDTADAPFELQISLP